MSASSGTSAVPACRRAAGGPSGGGAMLCLMHYDASVYRCVCIVKVTALFVFCMRLCVLFSTLCAYSFAFQDDEILEAVYMAALANSHVDPALAKNYLQDAVTVRVTLIHNRAHAHPQTRPRLCFKFFVLECTVTRSCNHPFTFNISNAQKPRRNGHTHNSHDSHIISQPRTDCCLAS